MASASTIPPQHVETPALQTDSREPDHAQWPSLNPDKEVSDSNNDWELVPPDPGTPATVSSGPQVTFDVAVLMVEPKKSSGINPKLLKHSQSSPNLRDYVLEEDADSTEESAVLIEDNSSMASSSMVMVPGPSSVWSVGSPSRLLFRDAMGAGHDNQMKKVAAPKPIRKVKPTFVVKKPMRRSYKSMPDLQAAAIAEGEDDVLGDTDAHEYYSRKARGAIGRSNGMKTRPDEAKRLQMTMAKKSLQRERQMARR